jgi:hypothetical protein
MSLLATKEAHVSISSRIMLGQEIEKQHITKREKKKKKHKKKNPREGENKHTQPKLVYGYICDKRFN